MTTEPLAPSPITFGRVVRYATLPGIVPRLRDLFGVGFGSFAFFVALVFRAVRLMPDGHPYLNPININRFGTVAVMIEAWRHIRFNRKTLGQKNLDQMVVFFLVLLALGLMAFQLVMVGLAVLFPQAMAFSFPGGSSFPTFFHMFDTPQIDPSLLPASGTSGVSLTQSHYDLSFIFLDRVFGVPGIFNSCIADGSANSCQPINAMYGAGVQDASNRVSDPGMFPWPYHIALQGMFQFYSVGLLVVAVFLLVYYTIVVVAETAQTGTPFGKRFNTLWAPLRLVTAAGLLIPISFGLNAGQYLVLYSAKWGANFASNGWIGFNQTLAMGAGATPVGDKTSLIARPGSPDPAQLLHFISVMQACKTIEEKVMQPREVEMYQGTDEAALLAKLRYIKPYLVRNSGNPLYLEVTESMTYDEAVKFSNLGDVVIRFGIQSDDRFKDKRGTVESYCGELTIPTILIPSAAVKTPTSTSYYQHVGAEAIMRQYWDFLKQLILKRESSQSYEPIDYGDGNTTATMSRNINQIIAEPYVGAYVFNNFDSSGADPFPVPDDRQAILTFATSTLQTIIQKAQEVEKTNATNPYAVPADLIVRGWAGAGIWYNRIAEMNGMFTTAVFNLPRISEYPMTMQSLARKKQAAQLATSSQDIFNPDVQSPAGPSTMSIVYDRGGDEARAANVYWYITKFWQDGGATTSTRGAGTGNVIIDLINFMFGTSGLFSIRENANVHPLAQLSSIGKSLIERSISLLGVGLAGTAIQPWIPESLSGMRAALGVISGFAFSVLSIGASAGFIMYYIIPLLPFIYFFFAVAGWVKAIFEAMIGVPLWALAHIRISGDGLPGDAAMQGYFLILEIMVRPILIVFGLIASVSIYGASVHVLNDIFNLAVSNVGGLDMDQVMSNPQVSLENLRGSVDTFFYTIMYAILVYMLGMSCFKLIDLIPGSMLRWLGSSASPFTDGGSEAASQLTSYGTLGSQMIFGQISGAAKGGISGISDMAKALKEQGQK